MIDEGIQVKTYDPQDYFLIMDHIEKFRHDVILKSGDKLIGNYTPERLDFREQGAISIGYYQNEIVALSTLFYTGHYKNGSRILNRYYLSKSIRTNTDFKAVSHNMVRQHTAEMVIGQLNRCKTTYAFVSREIPGKRYLNKFKEAMEPIHFEVTDSLKLVCPWPKSKGCWQYLAYKNLYPDNQDKFELLDTSIGEDEWRNL